VKNFQQSIHFALHARCVKYVLFFCIIVSSIFSDVEKDADINSWPYKIIFLVDNRDLDYRNVPKLLKSILNRPQFMLQPSDVGHAWLMLVSNVDDEKEIIHCGYNGETGKRYPRFFEGVFLHWTNPKLLNSKQQFFRKRFQNNPIAFMFQPMDDGHLEFDNYNYVPSYSAAMPITKDQYGQLRAYIQNFDKSIYSITQYQCVSFVTEIASQVGLKFDNRMILNVPKYLQMKNYLLKLWSHPKYCMFSFDSPDMLRKNLMEYVNNGTLVNANSWMKENHNRLSLNSVLPDIFDKITKPISDFRQTRKRLAYKKLSNEIR
jgi:hypothetical protein